jgi:hypothetical protein
MLEELGKIILYILELFDQIFAQFIFKLCFANHGIICLCMLSQRQVLYGIVIRNLNIN